MFAATLFWKSLLNSQIGMDARTTAVGPADRGRPSVAVWPAAVGVCSLLAILSAGCRVDPNIQLMEQELRMQNQRIFELEEHLYDCHAVAERERRENESLRRRLGEDSEDGGGVTTRSGAARPDRPETINGFTVPQIDEGDEISVSPESTPRSEPTPANGSPPEPADERDPAAESTGSRSREPESELLPPPNFTAADAIEQIGLRLAVRYHTEENTPVEVEALVQPQDSSLRQVTAVGDVSLMIVALEGETEPAPGKSELARWEFAEEDAKLLWRKSTLGTGLQFSLPWPGSPRAGKYRLWVKLVAGDQRRHLGSVDFAVDAEQLARRTEPRKPSPTEADQDGPLLVQAGGPEQTPPQPQQAAADPQDEQWRRSTDAARIARASLRQPTTPAATATRSSADEDEAGGSWSPYRATGNGQTAESDTRAASNGPQWAPYR